MVMQASKGGSGCSWYKVLYVFKCANYWLKERPSWLISTQITCVIGIATYFWIIDFPENAQRSFYFLNNEETLVAVRRIQEDRGDVRPAPFTIAEIAKHFLDPKIYGFAASFFLLVSSRCVCCLQRD